MDKFKFKKGVEDIQKIGMTNSDRDLVYKKVENYISKDIPLRIKSPWVSDYHFILGKASGVMALFVVLVLAGANTFVLSKNSIPGDILYPVKVNFYEPLKYTIASSPILKANVELENLDNRLREAEILLSQDRLSEEFQVDLENRLKIHKESFKKDLSGASQTDNLSTEETQVDFDAKINAHKNILDNFSVFSGSKNSDKAQEIKQTIEEDEISIQAPTVNNKIMMTTSLEVSSDSNISASSTPPKEESELFKTRRKNVEEIIKNVRENINVVKNKAVMNSFIIESAEKSIEEAQNSLDKANEDSNSGNEESALSSLLDSRKMAQEANTSIEIGQEIEENTLNY